MNDRITLGELWDYAAGMTPPQNLLITAAVGVPLNIINQQISTPYTEAEVRELLNTIMNDWRGFFVKGTGPVYLNPDGSRNLDTNVTTFQSNAYYKLLLDRYIFEGIAESIGFVPESEFTEKTTSTGTEKTTVTPTGTEKRTLAKGDVTTQHYYEEYSSSKAYESPTDKVSSGNDTDELTFVSRKTETEHAISASDPMVTETTRHNEGLLNALEKLPELRAYWQAVAASLAKTLVRIKNV